MKRILIYIGLLFGAGLGLISCYKDVNIPAIPPNSDAPPQYVSYSRNCRLYLIQAALCPDAILRVAIIHT